MHIPRVTQHANRTSQSVGLRAESKLRTSVNTVAALTQPTHSAVWFGGRYTGANVEERGTEHRCCRDRHVSCRMRTSRGRGLVIGGT